ncbi:MAG TPA: nitrile hydratase subunit beta [Steroidobacteraceae bacterium]|nr:nitrile hydratase subunit beta [Steroidobacteraceae bacterium]
MSYRSHADLGGQDGHGRVVPERESELFHAAWEPQALALTLAMGATDAWNIDMSRSARETLADYGTLTYYEIWIEGLVKLLSERGLVGLDEIAAARMLHPPRPVTRVVQAADVPTVLAKGSPTQRPVTAPALFAVNERVRTRTEERAHHTRLPGYARGKIGRIEHIRGVHVFADANAQGLGERPQWLYTVVFSGHELWGDASTQGLSVSIDAWESYLERLP